MNIYDKRSLGLNQIFTQGGKHHNFHDKEKVRQSG